MGFFNFSPGIDLKNTANMMSKIIRMLSNLETRSRAYIRDNHEGILLTAWMCRVGILDRIEKNGWSPAQTIFLPPFKKITIAEGLMDTVVKLKNIIDYDDMLSLAVDDILQKGDGFYEFEKNLTENQKRDYLK